jgi:hypothetical protein
MIQNHTFRDGITRLAHQHANGGAWIAESAFVSESAFVESHVEIIGGTILGGTIEGGTILGGTILGGTIEGGTIWGGTIRGGTIEGGTILGGTILGGTIEGGTILGGTILGGTIEGGTIRGGTIEGGTITKNVTFICGAIPHDVTITDDFCGVGCQWHTHDHWFKHGAAIMAEYEQKPELLAMLLQFIKMHKES